MDCLIRDGLLLELPDVPFVTLFSLTLNFVKC